MKAIKSYSASLKREVIREVKLGLISKAEVRRKYDIKGSSTIIGWIRKFDEQKSNNPQRMDYRKKDKEDLIKRIKELERQLEDEQIRSFGYSKMIDIAEDQLNVVIRKKPATKRSK